MSYCPDKKEQVVQSVVDAGGKQLPIFVLILSLATAAKGQAFLIYSYTRACPRSMNQRLRFKKNSERCDMSQVTFQLL